jgi:CRP/FNR family nitrogen fixation transcriptional regulator
MQIALAGPGPARRPAPACRDAVPGYGARPALGVARLYGKDERIFAEGDPAPTFYRVLSGAVRSFKLLADGRRQIDAFHLRGDVFGLETGAQHRFYAEAVGGATLLAIPRRAIEGSGGDDGLRAEVVTALRVELDRARDHMLLLGRRSALEKIATFLLGLAERTGSDDALELPMSRADIADHLGLTIETVSRSLTQLERSRVIEVPAHRRAIVLKRRAALEELLA